MSDRYSGPRDQRAIYIGSDCVCVCVWCVCVCVCQCGVWCGCGCGCVSVWGVVWVWHMNHSAVDCNDVFLLSTRA